MRGMIRARMTWNRLEMTVEGHAGYAEKGQDIVCAGASMLTGALGGVLEEARARGRTTFDWKERDGRLTIRADPEMGSLNEVKAYFRMCVKGMRMLQEQYPGNVKIEEEI